MSIDNHDVFESPLRLSWDGHDSSTIDAPGMQLGDTDAVLHSTNSLESDQHMMNVVHTKFLRFEVSDHGVGLTEEGRKNLFNPFQQAQKLAGGTG